MRIVIIGNSDISAELKTSETAENTVWLIRLEELKDRPDVLIDLLFDNEPRRLAALKKTGAATIIINSVSHTLSDLNADVVRINGWKTFLSGKLVEAAAMSQEKMKVIEQVFSTFGRSIEWVDDQPGFVTPRVVAMIINEAYFALAEGVSTREEIDTAMKLGTNYPYGPFEWAEKIGVKNVAALLSKLAEINPRYQPAALLSSENYSNQAS
jgi:3-hydroxybutyryl-CoA dehydrogenase